MKATKRWALLSASVCLFAGVYACGSTDGDNAGGGNPGSDGTSADGTGTDGSGGSTGASDGGSVDSSATGGSSTTGSGTGGSGIILNPIPGGGENTGPLNPGCGPETAHDCLAPGGGCNPGEGLPEDHEVKDSGAVCFYGPGREDPSATVEYITETLNGEEYVHIRVTFDPNFVDTTYGECSADTGWNPKRPHTFKDLRSSDHVELMLYNCNQDLSMHFKVDFIEGAAETECGYASAGVNGGDGELFVGNLEDFLAVTTSLDRNMNGCGYCDDTASPCTDETYASDPNAPEWDFRMVYEVWIKASAFGESGFCTTDIEYVHASPAKGSTDTIYVEPDDCPPPDNDCPPDYELYLTSEGRYLCAGPPEITDGGTPTCPDGYVIDVTSEGRLCIPESEQL